VIVPGGTVVIVSPPGDLHAQAVRDRLLQRGTGAVLLDTAAFPGALRISLGHELDDIEVDGRRVTPSAVYVRDLAANPIGAGEALDAELRRDWRRAMAALRERSDFVLSILHRWEQLGIPIYNPLSAYPRVTKPYQLALLAQAGLPVPATRWTNDPDAVRGFAAARRVAYKPVSGGAVTRELGERDLEDARLGRLRAAPVCFQELLPGPDLRVYVVDGEVAASIRIISDALDFRQHEQAMDAFPLDGALRSMCVRATAVLGLRFTGMDLKLDGHGAPRILELNPSPMFLGFDARAGTDVLGALTAALAAGRCAPRRGEPARDDRRRDVAELC
jgi:glutathione synthase/RimK-type ligase-like ATP-grasp enzyme